MLTAHDRLSDAALGLQLGADDYIPKPFYVDELLAGIDAIVGRTNASQNSNQIVKIRDIEIDLLRLRAIRNGDRSTLGRKNLGFYSCL